MSHPEFQPNTVDDCLSHAAEECGEFIVAAMKAERFGYLSVNPLLPKAAQETNLARVRREMADARQAFDRLEAKLDEAFK